MWFLSLTHKAPETMGSSPGPRDLFGYIQRLLCVLMPTEGLFCNLSNLFIYLFNLLHYLSWNYVATALH